MTVAIGLAERGAAESEAEEKRIVAAVMQYLDGRTIDDFRAANLRVVSARNIELDPEERATLSLLRSWRIRNSRKAA